MTNRQTGETLEPLLLAMIKWGSDYIDDTYVPTEEEIKKYRQMVIDKKKK
jgi:DNA-binding HxlR family transcriptional regulator